MKSRSVEGRSQELRTASGRRWSDGTRSERHLSLAKRTAGWVGVGAVRVGRQFCLGPAIL